MNIQDQPPPTPMDRPPVVISLSDMQLTERDAIAVANGQVPAWLRDTVSQMVEWAKDGRR